MPESGIYAIRHIESGKLYVGSSSNIASRWQTHRWALGRGIHHSRHLQNAWDKYGADAFVFEVLQAVENPDDLIRTEQEHLDRTGSFRRTHGYNILPKAGSCLGVKRLAEQRLAMSAAQQDRHDRRMKAQVFEPKKPKPGQYDGFSPGLDELTGLGRQSERDGAIVALNLKCGWSAARIAKMFRMSERMVQKVVSRFKSDHPGWEWWTRQLPHVAVGDQ
jgi:hypothetical protein